MMHWIGIPPYNGEISDVGCAVLVFIDEQSVNDLS